MGTCSTKPPVLGSGQSPQPKCSGSIRNRPSVLMVSTSSRAKSNNFVAGNKLNSHFRKSYAGRHGEQIEISAVEKTAQFAFSKPRSVANSQINGKDCSDDAGDFRNGFPSLELS